MAINRVITLTADFGSSDAYVAAMKGVILSINPRATIVDLCHSIEPQNVFQGAFVLSTAYQFFPEGTIHIVVVDPGVGSLRRAVLLVTPSAFFVAPDNGVLSFVTGKESARLKEYCQQTRTPFSNRASQRGKGGKVAQQPQIEEVELRPPLQAIVLSNPRFWRHPVSSTFHGRDIFAPVAAHLSLGVPPQDFGQTTSRLLTFSLSQPEFRAGGEIRGHIIHIDHFGNLVTNIKGSDLPQKNIIIEIGGQRIEGISSSYEPGDILLALVGSSDYLEIAARRDSAARLLRAKVGDEVRLFPRQ